MSDPRTITIPSAINAAAAGPLHEMLCDALMGPGTILLELDKEAGRAEAGALALQLLVSAERSFPPDRLVLGAEAEAALIDVSGRGAAGRVAP